MKLYVVTATQLIKIDNNRVQTDVLGVFDNLQKAQEHIRIDLSEWREIYPNEDDPEYNINERVLNMHCW